MKRLVETLPSSAEYHAYVLRVWRESETAPWRYSLQRTDGGKRHGFASFEQLATYLHQGPPAQPLPMDRGRDRSDHTPERSTPDDTFSIAGDGGTGCLHRGH